MSNTMKEFVSQTVQLWQQIASDTAQIKNLYGELQDADEYLDESEMRKFVSKIYEETGMRLDVKDFGESLRKKLDSYISAGDSVSGLVTQVIAPTIRETGGYIEGQELTKEQLDKTIESLGCHAERVAEFKKDLQVALDIFSESLIDQSRDDDDKYAGGPDEDEEDIG